MANCDRIPIYALVRGWLDQLEVEHLNYLNESRNLREAGPCAFTTQQVRYAVERLHALRAIRQRIPHAWKKATVTE